jgi:hypothetical protein
MMTMMMKQKPFKLITVVLLLLPILSGGGVEK